jgi:predicted RNA-binding Zn-ribbon protein involved in translation (DUF1610 family)
MADETFHPLVYFWVAFYKDGTCLLQFDVKTGKGNSFVDIDQNKLDKFGLFPFTTELAFNANRIKGFIVAREVENLSYHIMKLQENQRLIFIRRNKIHVFTFYHCEKCGYNWQWMEGHKEGETTEVGLLIHSNRVEQEFKGKKFPLAQCPKCGAFNAIMCPDCGTLINEMEKPDTKEHYFMCPKCNKEHPRHLKMLEDQLRTMVYILGYQTTVDGKNIKHLMFIDEDGTLELKGEC